MAIVAAAPDARCAATSSWIAAALTSGTSPERTTTGGPGSVSGSAARTAPPVPSGTGCVAVRVPSGSAAARSTFGEATTTTRSAPAARAATTGQATIGRPQISCRTLGVAERIRVPCPAAITTALKEVTGRRLERGRPSRLGGSDSNRDCTAPKAGGLPLPHPPTRSSDRSLPARRHFAGASSARRSGGVIGSTWRAWASPTEERRRSARSMPSVPPSCAAVARTSLNGAPTSASSSGSGCESAIRNGVPSPVAALLSRTPSARSSRTAARWTAESAGTSGATRRTGPS